MRILLLSAYEAVSHRYWREGLQAAFPDVEWVCLSLPARHYAWRVRSNSMTWGFGDDARLQEGRFDLLIATSMVDLSALRGFLPHLASVPTMVYCHENQFAYPEQGQSATAKANLLAMQLQSLYTALCADALVFNSDYNRSTFLDGVDTMLKRMPDGVPPGLVGKLLERSTVLPVPLSDSLQPVRGSKNDGQVRHLVWNHRWEYDKGPARLLALVDEVIARDLPMVFHIVGQQFRHRPAEFELIQQRLRGWRTDALASWGTVEGTGDYHRLLQNADLVLSTAEHDFQGLAVMEAVAAGCVPILPQRLAYPEFFPAFCYLTSEDLQLEARAASDLIEASVDLPVATVETLRWSVLRESYEALMRATAALA